MTVTLNDAALELPAGATLEMALEAKQIDPKGKATALNGSVVPAVLRGATELNEGDKIVIIKAFYGG